MNQDYQNIGMSLEMQNFSGTSSDLTIENLKQQLKSNNSEYRINALHQLRKSNFLETNILLKEILKHDSENSVRELALLILHERNDPEIITIMRRIYLNTNENHFIRGRAIWSLSQFNDPSATEILYSAIDDKSEEVVYWAILGLLNHEINDTVILNLNSLLNNKRSSLIQQVIIFYFGSIKTESSCLILEEQLITSPYPLIRLQAAWALRNINSIKSVNILCNALLREISDLTKREIALSIGNIVQKQSSEIRNTNEFSIAVDNAITCLTKVFIGDTSYIVRRASAESLGRIGDRRSVSSLLEKISIDTNIFVRRDIIIALGKIRDPQALDALKEAENSNYSIIVQAAQGAINQIKNRQ